MPFAVAQERTGRGVLVPIRGTHIRLIGEGQGVSRLSRLLGLCEQGLGHARLGVLARFEPETIGSAQILPQIGARGRQEDPDAAPRRCHRAADAARRASDDDHVDVIRDRDTPCRCGDCVRFGRGRRSRTRPIARARALPRATRRQEKEAQEQEGGSPLSMPGHGHLLKNSAIGVVQRPLCPPQARFQLESRRGARSPSRRV